MKTVAKLVLFFAVFTFLVLLALQVMGTVALHWGWVFSPLWIPVAVLLGGGVLVAGVLGVRWLTVWLRIRHGARRGQ